MSKINFLSLGGLGENGMNLYLLIIDEKIFVLDAGIKYPTKDQYGVDYILPDLTYLREHKENIVGLFLSHGHDQAIGAVSHILKEFNIPVYGSKFTLAIVKDDLIDHDLNIKDYKLVQFPNKPLYFDKIKVTSFSTTHNIPESMGYIFHTNDGPIIYTGEYCLNQNVTKEYETDFKNLVEVSSKKPLMLISESLGADKNKSNGDYYAFMHKLNYCFKSSKGRMIFSIYSSDLRRIQTIIDLALKYNKKIAIIGRKTQRIVDIGINLGYIKVPLDSFVNLRYIDDKNTNNDKDLVVLVTGVRHEPFYMLQRMCKKLDRLIHINKDDTVIILTLPNPTVEKMAARTLDLLYRNDVTMFNIDKNILESSHAYAEEIKLLYNMVKPKYSIPVIGEYRHQYAHKNICKQLGYSDENIILLDKGEMIEFIDGNYVSKKQTISLKEVLSDGLIAGDVNDVVLREREILSLDGIVLINANIDTRKRLINYGPEIISKGFVYVKDSEELFLGIKEIFNKITDKYFKLKYIVWNDYKQELKQEVSKYLFKETKKNPFIIPVIIASEKN